MNETSFENRQDLIDSVKSHYLDQGICLSLGKNCNTRTVVFKCYFGGQNDNKLGLSEETRQRETGSRLRECPFKITARYSKRENRWNIKDTVNDHNHEFGPNLGGIATARRLTEDERLITRQMADAGSTSAATLAYIRATTGNQWTTTQEIYNEKSRARREIMNGRTPIQTFYDEISHDDYIVKLQVDDTGAIRNIFFTHHSSAELARRYHSVFIMDCTYKTNKFKMPLLNIVRITSTYSTFNAGFAFLIYCCSTQHDCYRSGIGAHERHSRSFPIGKELALYLAHQQKCFSQSPKIELSRAKFR